VGDASEPAPALLLIAAWHLPRMRSLPRALWRVRRLDRSSRASPGCFWMHRWLSRRSLALTSAWASEGAAEAWLASVGFRETDSALVAAGARRLLLRGRPPVEPARDAS
jgi:hypothetical protein